MKITTEEVEHVAHLARLNLEKDELISMTSHLDTILSYFEKLEELNTEGVVPTTHTLSVTNAFREDKVKPSLLQKEALAGSIDANENSFVVPRII